jgi:hypothetical protein
MITLFNQTFGLYQQLFSTYPLNGTFPLSNANFWDAYNLYDYVRYMYNHNETVNDGLRNPNRTIDILQNLAEDQQLAMNSDKVASGLKGGDMIRTVAGRTLAQKVLDQFEDNQSWGGSHNKLTVMFGSFEPFLAFFSLARLQGAITDDEFKTIPEPGASMIFELIGDDPNQPGTYPSWDNLKVRFVYRKDTNNSTPFMEHSILGNSNMGHVMSYRSFKSEMEKIALDVNEWCQTCDSIQLFCTGRKSNSNSGSSSVFAYSASNPTVAGVIGAAIAVAVLGFAVLAAVVFGGMRFHRAGHEKRASALGGFKGPEKMASDTDLTVSKGGAHHERVGSWELRDGNNVAERGVGGDAVVVTTKDFSRKRDDDDDISEIGVVPVKPRESF